MAARFVEVSESQIEQFKEILFCILNNHQCNFIKTISYLDFVSVTSRWYSRRLRWLIVNYNNG